MGGPRTLAWIVASALAAALSLALATAYRYGAASERYKAVRAAAETNERLNDADVSDGDGAADLDWLRDRAR